VTLPALGEASIDVPVKVRTGDLVDALARLGRVQRLSYSIDGRLGLAGSDAGRSLAFDDEGELPLPSPRPAGLAP
jgi:hypothetical protein